MRGAGVVLLALILVSALPVLAVAQEPVGEEDLYSQMYQSVVKARLGVWGPIVAVGDKIILARGDSLVIAGGGGLEFPEQIVFIAPYDDERVIVGSGSAFYLVRVSGFSPEVEMTWSPGYLVVDAAPLADGSIVAVDYAHPGTGLSYLYQLFLDGSWRQIGEVRGAVIDMTLDASAGIVFAASMETREEVIGNMTVIISSGFITAYNTSNWQLIDTIQTTLNVSDMLLSLIPVAIAASKGVAAIAFSGGFAGFWTPGGELQLIDLGGQLVGVAASGDYAAFADSQGSIKVFRIDGTPVFSFDVGPGIRWLSVGGTLVAAATQEGYAVLASVTEKRVIASFPADAEYTLVHGDGAYYSGPSGYAFVARNVSMGALTIRVVDEEGNPMQAVINVEQARFEGSEATVLTEKRVVGIVISVPDRRLFWVGAAYVQPGGSTEIVVPADEMSPMPPWEVEFPVQIMVLGPDGKRAGGFRATLVNQLTEERFTVVDEDEDGEEYVTLPGGIYSASFEAPLMMPKNTTLLISDSSSIIVNMEYEKFPVTFRALDEQGHVISNILIKIGDNIYKGPTVELMPGEYEAVISAKGYEVKSVKVKVPAPGGVVEVRLKHITYTVKITLKGRIIIPPSKVTITYGTIEIGGTTYYVDENGVAEVKLAPGDYEVVASAPGFSTAKKVINVAGNTEYEIVLNEAPKSVGRRIAPYIAAAIVIYFAVKMARKFFKMKRYGEEELAEIYEKFGVEEEEEK